MSENTTLDPHPLKSVRSRHVSLQTFRVIFALLMREVTTSFGRSILGYLWALLEPIGFIVVLTLAFSIIFKHPPLGDSFPLFYATGFLPFSMYNTSQSKMSTAIAQNKALLFYPAVTYTDVLIARFLLIALTELTVALIVLSGLMIFTHTAFVHSIPLVMAGLLLALALGGAVGVINATLFEIFPAWRSLWKILSRPMFFISGVFYIFDSLPASVQSILWWNPLVHAIGSVRVGIYPEYEGSYISWLYATLIALILTTIGLVNLRISNKFIINN